MQERGDRKDSLNPYESILTPEHVEDILARARRVLEHDGYLESLLFLNLLHGEKVVTKVSLPYSHQEKQAYFTFLGKAIRYAGHKIGEAILLSESWVVLVPESNQLRVSPSHHPNRREAITLVGRNAINNRLIFAVQTFSRNDQDRLIFDPIKLNQVSGSLDPEYYAAGLLDYLFDTDKRIMH